ncbi:MAG: hypothetical protein P8N19_01465 [Flavobacteriales bacterium]|nr:hypothetical protein [Flavobacteriales bacterium]
MWFKDLTGFQEASAEEIREQLKIVGNQFVSKANSRRFTFGRLEVASLDDLRGQNKNLSNYSASIQVREIVANVQDLHSDVANSNALFQAASQFNLLEMVSPTVSPEDGIDGYEYDYTQGPACAISCGAGTIYRNYFVEVNNQIGQTKNQQVDCLDLLGEVLNNEEEHLWIMQNGYALATRKGLESISKTISALDEFGREALKGKIKTGIQWNTEVTIAHTRHLVSQIYCSALPVAYSSVEPSCWEAFARLILEATYESTLHAAVLNMENSGCNKVFLTLVGGGAFGNQESWILESLQLALNKFKNTPLDVQVVSYGQSNPNLKKCLENITILD